MIGKEHARDWEQEQEQKGDNETTLNNISKGGFMKSSYKGEMEQKGISYKGLS